jgi:hypothetical protein
MKLIQGYPYIVRFVRPDKSTGIQVKMRVETLSMEVAKWVSTTFSDYRIILDGHDIVFCFAKNTDAVRLRMQFAANYIQ